MESNISQQFQEATTTLNQWSIEDYSNEERLKTWAGQARAAVDETVSTYRKFINNKETFAARHDRAVFANLDFCELQQQFFSTSFSERFRETAGIDESGLHHIYWCIVAADYLALRQCLDFLPGIANFRLPDGSTDPAKTRAGRYINVVRLVQAMETFVSDLSATIGEQRKPGSYLQSTKWPFDFRYFAEALLMSRTLDGPNYIDISAADHVTAGVVLRSWIESIAYRRDRTAVGRMVSEEPDSARGGEVYEKIRLLHDKIDSEQITYLCKTYDALNLCVHHALNFSTGEIWIFLETVRRIEKTLHGQP